jgi:hypothetical protein
MFGGTGRAANPALWKGGYDQPADDDALLEK